MAKTIGKQKIGYDALVKQNSVIGDAIKLAANKAIGTIQKRSNQPWRTSQPNYREYGVRYPGVPFIEMIEDQKQRARNTPDKVKKAIVALRKETAQALVKAERALIDSAKNAPKRPTAKQIKKMEDEVDILYYGSLEKKAKLKKEAMASLKNRK